MKRDDKGSWALKQTKTLAHAALMYSLCQQDVMKKARLLHKEFLNKRGENK